MILRISQKIERKVAISSSAFQGNYVDFTCLGL